MGRAVWLAGLAAHLEHTILDEIEANFDSAPVGAIMGDAYHPKQEART
jgi:hypothetical protein